MNAMAEARNEVKLMVASDRPEVLARAQVLADRLGIKMVDRANPQAGVAMFLVMTDDHLELADGDTSSGRGVMVDWREFLGRGKGTLSKRQPLARAIGRDSRTVLDATVGLGRDAAMLAALGYEVTAVERSPIVFALLEDGLRRAMDDPIMRETLGGRLHIVQGEASEVLERLEPKPDAVLIDPMYPPRRKASALAGKAIRMVREVVGADDDAAELLATARRLVRRVAVKRADDAPPLAESPSGTIEGKTVRFDLYAR